MPAKVSKTIEDRRARVKIMLPILKREYPDAKCRLDHRNPLELLVATILSAQCTDDRVNIVTKKLFRDFPTARDYARVPQEKLEKEIQSTGFFRNKARSIQEAGQLLVEKFGGRVPETMEELLELPGVARKTANVVLGVAFGHAEGVVVDTHVARVSRRLDLTTETEPRRIERDLMALLPRRKWIAFSHQTIHHGRRVCKALRPLCPVCPVEKICESPDKALAFASGRRAARS